MNRSAEAPKKESGKRAIGWPFASKRERGLWLWVCIVQLAIFSSLGLARPLVDFLRARARLEVSLAFAILVVLLPLAWQWLKRRPGWSEVGVAIGVIFAYWMAFIRIENPAERTHLVEYGVLAALIHMALLERHRSGLRVPMPAALAVAATSILGLIDEGIQLFLPNRVFDWIDVFFNALAAFMIVVARLAFAPVIGPGWRLWFLWFMAGAVGWGLTTDPSLFGEGRLFEFMPPTFMLTLPPFPSVAVGASLVGLLHWLILRRYLRRSFRWALASLASAIIGWGLLWLLSYVDPDTGFIASVALHGTVAGLLHWLVLRSEMRRAAWWIVGSTIGWLVALPVGDLAGPPGWAIYGAVTGTLLIGLLCQES